MVHGFGLVIFHDVAVAMPLRQELQAQSFLGARFREQTASETSSVKCGGVLVRETDEFPKMAGTFALVNYCMPRSMLKLTHI